MPWIVSNISLKQQQRGPIWNVIVTVAGVHLDKEVNDKRSDNFTLDDKVTVCFNPRFNRPFTWHNELLLTPYVSIQKIESVQNCNVEITSHEFRRVLTCSEEWIEVNLNSIKPDQGHEVSVESMRTRLYIFEVNITVHEMSMSIHSIHTKLYEDTEFTDFQLKAPDGAVAVHKSILAFQSDMFKTMLKGEWKETVEGCINIDGVTIETLQHLKDYMYLGTVGTLPDEGLEPLILLADHYLMDKLKTDCITKLVKSVKPENFGRIVKFAYQSGLSEELVSALISLSVRKPPR